MNIKIQQPIAIHELGKRQNQEDAIYPAINKATTDDRLFLVCDGMGGHEKGEVASNLVCSVLSDFITSKNAVLTDELLKEALEQVYVQLDSKDDGAYKKMGTTLTLLYFHKEGCTLAHIGDSRIYHIRPADKKMLYKSRDHSLVYDLYQSGEISFEEMKTSPQKNVITRALMPGKDNRVRADITHVTDIQPGDYFYLCSDGMLEQMEDSELLQLLSADSSNEKKRSLLVAATMDNSDNHSAYLIQVSDVMHEESDQNIQNNEQNVPWNVADELMAMGDVEDAIDISVVETPDVPEKVTPRTTVRHKKQQKSKSYISYIVAALVIALLFFIFGLMKGCHRTAKTEEPNDWSTPVDQPQRNVMQPVRRASTKQAPAKKNNPKVTVTSDQKTEKVQEEPQKEQVVAEPVKKEEKNVKETPADQVKKELNKKLEERKAVKQEIPVVQEKKEQPVENNQDQ